MKVISLINMKGGVAKTTMSINVADCLYRMHDKKVLLLDVDPQFNATQCLLSAENYVEHIQSQKDTILDVFDRTIRPTVGIVDGPAQSAPKKLGDIQTVKIREGFHLLPGALELYRLEMAPGGGREHRLKRFLDTLKDIYDYVIIDTPPTPSVWMTSALIASDYYLIPVKADPISLTGIDLLQGIINEKKENFALTIKCIGLILTIVETHTLVYRTAKNSLSQSKRWKELLYSKNLPKRIDVARQQLSQQLILSNNSPELKSAISGITNELIARIRSHEKN